MFISRIRNFFSKNEEITEIEPTKKNDSKKQDKENTALKAGVGFATGESARISTERLGVKYAKPDYTGNRSSYDNNKNLRNFKNQAFADGPVIDPYTGKELVLTVKEAKALYGDNWQEHLAEADHIHPLSKVVNENKDNVWTSAEDLKEIANSKENIEQVSRKYNNAKRDRTNEELVKDDKYLEEKNLQLSEKQKDLSTKRGKDAKNTINKKVETTTIKNVVNEGHKAGVSSATSASITCATMSGIMNITAVIKGEKEAKEAIKDVAVDTGKAAATGYAVGGGLTVISHTLSNSSSEFIKALVKSNVPANIITAVMVTGNTLSKYASGEISTEECLLELGEKGITTVTTGYSMVAGQWLIPIPVVGAAIGALVGSVLTSECYNAFAKQLETKELEHQERLRIMAECKFAKEKSIALKQELEAHLEAYFAEYRFCFNDALSDIQTGFQSGDADLTIAGANKITQKLGGEVKYETVSQFKSFLKSDEVDVF